MHSRRRRDLPSDSSGFGGFICGATSTSGRKGSQEWEYHMATWLRAFYGEIAVEIVRCTDGV